MKTNKKWKMNRKIWRKFEENVICVKLFASLVPRSLFPVERFSIYIYIFIKSVQLNNEIL